MLAFAVVLIGDRKEPTFEQLKREFAVRTQALSHAGEQFQVLGHNQLNKISVDTCAAAVVLCRKKMRAAEVAAIQKCVDRNLPTFPVVSDLKLFLDLAPRAVAALNGYELSDIRDTSEFVGLVLEVLGLQRAKRKIFISYARTESSHIARQLRDAFTARWYSVFLDTISIRPGVDFQKQLLHELADSDVMVLLNSPSIVDRPYVQQEIAFADQAGLGGVQVTWPNVRPRRDAGFFQPISLDHRLTESRDGRVTTLTPAGIVEVMRTVADLRSALQQQREMRLIRPITAYARRKRWRAIFHPGRYIELRGRKSQRIRLDLALGAPTSYELERACRNADTPGAGRLVYDPLGITNELADHLEFMRARLGLQYLDPKDSLRWSLIP